MNHERPQRERDLCADLNSNPRNAPLTFLAGRGASQIAEAPASVRAHQAVTTSAIRGGFMTLPGVPSWNRLRGERGSLLNSERQMATNETTIMPTVTTSGFLSV